LLFKIKTNDKSNVSYNLFLWAKVWHLGEKEDILKTDKLSYLSFVMCLLVRQKQMRCWFVTTCCFAKWSRYYTTFKCKYPLSILGKKIEFWRLCTWIWNEFYRLNEFYKLNEF
jgi:hypothetical protein